MFQAEEIENLKLSINSEEEIRQAVEASYNELSNTANELDKRLDIISNQSEFLIIFVFLFIKKLNFGKS
jgi:regulator of sirC expression with transglutaminase-like and TPR domain